MIKPLFHTKFEYKQQHCFGGAWYHKVMSVPYDFRGIEGIITLPMPYIARYKDESVSHIPINPELTSLDVSSIYIGATALYESDCGLALSRALLNGKVTEGSCVYRPFWRYITTDNYDDGDYDLANNRHYKASVLSNHDGVKNIYAHYHPSETSFYYLPGDRLKMSLISTKDNFLVLSIEVISISTLQYSVDFRKKYNLANPKSFKSPLISSPGHEKGKLKVFKRVNAIDQAGNEGLSALLTKTKVEHANWVDCYLLYEENNHLFKTPFNDSLSVTMQCPNPKAFVSSKIDNETGAQIITIEPMRTNI